MSRTERKLRQALAEIEALRADRPKLEESLALLTNQNVQMHSALREAEIVLTAMRAVEAETVPPAEWYTRLEFALMLVRTALGMQPAKQALWCAVPPTKTFELFAISTDGHTDECSGWTSLGCDCGRKLPR